MTTDNYVIEGNQCININKCKYLNYDVTPTTSTCLSSCSAYTTYISGKKYCSTTCRDDTPYISEIANDKICLNSCSSKFYYATSPRKCVSVTDAQNCYYTGSGSGLKECKSECPNGNKYHNVGSHQCISGCTGNFLYHKKDDYICYESCDLIPDIGKNYIILSGNTCDCGLYADDTGKKVCYNNEEECLNKGYIYKLGNKCIKTGCPFKVESGTNTGSENYLKKCFSLVRDCSNNNFPYYNIGSKTCWASCPDNMYSNPLDSLGKPMVDNSGNTCTSECTDPFTYKSDITKTCKEKCDPGEYIKEDTKECLSNCPDTYFIGEKNECFSSCNSPKFIIEYPGTSKKKKCVSRCANYGKFYDSESNKCKDTCVSGTNYPYFYNSDNKCLSECNNTNINKMGGELYNYVDSKLLYQPCLNDTQKDKYYYYENDYNVYDTCDIFENINTHICSDCNGKFVYKNYCVNKCPLEAPLIM